MVDFDYTGLELVDVPEGAPEALREMREAGGYDYPDALDWSGLELVETGAPPAGTETAPAAPDEGPGREVSETTTLGEIGEIPAGVAAGAVGTAGTALQGVSAAFPPARDDIPEDRKAALRGKMREAEDALMRGDVDAYSRLTREIHAEALVPVTRRAGFQAGQRIRDWGQRTFPATEGYEDSFGRQVGEGVGSLVTGIAASAVHPGAATVLFTTLGMGESADRAAQSLAEKHGQEAVDRGEFDEQIARATLLGVGPGMTDQIPVEILLKRLPVPGARAVGQAIRSFGGERVMRALGRIGSQAVIEAVQEGGQQTLQNLIARHVHTPETEIAEGVLPSAGVGGAVGTIAGVGREAVLNLAGRRSRSTRGVRARAAEEVPPPSPEDEASPIPTETIDEGRRVVADAEGRKVANRILSAEGMPAIGAPVRIGIGRKAYEGVVTDAWGEGPGAGITVTEPDGTVIDSTLEELHALGAEIEILSDAYVEGEPEAVPPEIADQDRHISEIAGEAAPSADVETTAGTEADTGGWTPPTNLPSLSPRQADAVADLVRGGMDADRAVAVAAAMPAGDVETAAPVATETVPRPAVDAPAAAEDAGGEPARRPPPAPPTPAPETLPEGDVETTAPVESDLEIVEMAPEQGRPDEAARPDVPIPAPPGEPTTLTGRPISEYGPVRSLESETMVDETVETEAPVETPPEAAPAAEPAGMTAMERLARRQTQLRVSRMSPDEAREHLDALRLAGRNVEGIEIPTGRPEPGPEAAEPGDVDEMGPVESPDLPPGWSMHRRSDGKYVANNARWRMPARDTAEEAVDAAVEQEATGERLAAARARAEAEGLTGQDALRRVAEIMEGQPARGEVNSDSGDAVAPVTASDQDERRPSVPPGGAVGISGQEPARPEVTIPESTPSPGQPGRELVLRKDGQPFKTARVAELAARSKLKAGKIGDDYMVVDHAGGFAIEVAAQGEQDGQEAGPVPAGREAGRDVPPDGEGAGPVGPGRAEAGPVEPVDAGAEPEIRAGAGVPAAVGVEPGGGVAPEIVVRKNGEPFKGIGSARAAAKAAGVENFRPVRVDGGYGYEVTEEAPAVTRAREDAAEAPRNQVPGAAPSRPVREVDRPARVITPAGRRVEVQPIVIEARDLIASHDETGRENPTFPSEFQPRDRSRAASQEQIASMAGELIPELLMPSPQSSEGAPVVGPDRVVESGNARTLALRRAYEMNLADDYRNHLIERGYDIEGFDQPVLVQQRVTAMTPEERAEFAREANARTTADRGASEVAKSDAASIDRSLLDFYEPGDVASAGNREFVRQFIASVVPEMERAGMMAADGTLSQAGKQRIENALFDAAYDDAELLGALREDIDSNVKSLGGAMLDAAPEWARMRRGVQDGSVEPMVDQTEHILSAVRMVRKARSEGVRLAELVRQDEMFSESQMSAEAEMWLRSMYADPVKLTRPYGRQRLAEGLIFYATEGQKKTAGANLFGETVDESEISRMMELTRQRIARTEDDRATETQAQTDLLGGPPAPGARPDDAGLGGDRAGQEVGDGAEGGRERGAQEGRQGSPEGLEESGVADDFQPRQLSLFADGGSGAVPDGPAGAAAPDRPSREFRGIAKADVLALEDVRVGLTHVRLPEDAAHVAAPFRKEPQETALGIVLDRDDRLVGTVRHAVGSANFTPVDPAHFVGAIAQIPDAHSFYLAHQHPSGKLEQSRGDAQMNRKVADLTRATDIRYRGSIVVAPGQAGATFAGPDAGLGETEEIGIRPAARTASVPVYRRRFARIPPLRERVQVNTYERVKKAVERFLPEKSGVLLVDNNLNLVGAFAMDTAEMSRLRGKGGAARDLMSAMAETNATRMMFAARDESSVPAVSADNPAREALNNMRRFSRALTVDGSKRDFVSILYDAKGEVVSQVDEELDDRTFLQRGAAEPRPPVARLTGQELGREGIPLAILRGRARRWYRENLIEPGRTVVNENDGREIGFDRTGQGKTSTGGEELLRIVPAIPEILRKGVPLGEGQPDKKGRRQIGNWYRYGGTVQVGDRPMDVVLHVRERQDGTFHYSLQHGADISAGAWSSTRAAPFGGDTALEGGPSAEDSIADPDDEIKFQRATPEEFAISTEAQLQRARGDEATGDLFGRDVKSQRPIDEGLFAQGVPKPEFTEQDEAPPPPRPERPARESAGGEFDLFSATPPARQKPVEPSKAIGDFGEKIEGARKDLAAAVRDRLTRAADIDIASAPLSESFPQLDYAKMAEAGMDRRRLALYAVLRSTVPNKPRRTYKLRRWVNDVEVVRDMARQAMDEDSDIGGIEDVVGEQYALTAEMLSGLDPELWVKAGKYRIGYGRMSGRDNAASRHMYFLHRKGRLYTEGDSENRAEAIEAARGIVRRELAAEAARPKTRSKLTKINVYQDRRTKDVFLGFKGNRQVVRLKTGFANASEAREYLAANREDLQVKIDELRKGPSMRRDTNRDREGKPRREGDVTPQLFTDMFGFRGVQFGNYVEGGRRQKDLNDSFDALMDLADAVDVPPKALALDGTLGLAFGARGRGGRSAAAAHYEPDQVVINLTKTAGPGSLAHEWLHALDNNFGTRAGGRFLTDTARPGEGMRPEVAQAWRQVTEAIDRSEFSPRSREFDASRSKPYWSQPIEKAARAFERYVHDRLAFQGFENDYLVNIDLTGGAYPTAEEMRDDGIAQAFDRLFDAIESRETPRGTMLYQRAAAPEVPEPIVRKDGQPFKSRGSARTAARLRNLDAADVIEIEGGYALQTAWHGSPHRFDEFSTEGIGTGEGAQAYGWGLYFAEKKGVADHYRRALAGRTTPRFFVNGEEMPIGAEEYLRTIARRPNDETFGAAKDRALERLDEDIRFIEGKASELERWRTSGMDPATRPVDMVADERLEERRAYRAKIAAMKSGDLQERMPGATYRVDLAPAEDEYLLWDRPYDEQSDKVKEGLRKLWRENKGGRDEQPFAASGEGAGIYRAMAGSWFYGSQKEASRALLRSGVRGIKYLDGSSRNKSFKEIRDEFLQVLPENASVEEAGEMIGTGEFSPKYDAVLRELADNDWLGFDYAAQAIRAAYSPRVGDWDPSPELMAAISASRAEGTYNYVIFDDSDVAVEEILHQREAQSQPVQPDARVRIRPTRRFDAERLAIRAEIESLGERAFGKGFNIRLADRILTPEGDQATGAFDPAARIAYIALRDPAAMTGTLHHEGLHYLRRAGAFTKKDGTPTASWKVLEAEAPRWREKYRIDERYPENIGEDLLNEEAIAEAIDDYAKNKPPEIAGKVKLAMDRILAFWKRVGNAIRGRGFRTATDVFESIRSGDFAGPDGQADPEAMDRYLQTAWHASPNVFGQFSTDYMGEGEGAQGFGWGLYFASRRGVADFYREGLTKPTLFVGGQEASALDWGTSANGLIDEMARQMSAGASFEDARRSALRILDAAIVVRRDQRKYWQDKAESNRPRAARSLAAAERSLDEARRVEQGIRGLTADEVTLGQTGATYRVDLAPKEDEYLLWDAQMAAQPEPVRDALKSMGLGTREYLTGEEMYRSASRDLGSDRAASEAFLAAGIRGIKYLDQSSRPMRGALGRARMPLSKETHNYVIFDDSDVAIEEILLQRRPLGEFDTEPGAEGFDQAIIPGAEPLTEREIAERRMRGRMTTDREQKPMDEGLFGAPEEEQMTLFQRETVATREFRRWFGDSKAVDDQGEPLVAYHGGRLDEQVDGVPSIPHEGIFFTTSRALGESYRGGGRLTRAFLKIENPFEPTNPDHVNAPWVQEWIDFWREEDGWIDRYSGEEMSDGEVKDMIADTMLASYDSTGAMPRWHDFLATARDHHDGFIGTDPTDRVEYADPTILVAFEPTQIKSADGTGTFDPENPDIRFQRVSAENREPFEEAASQQFGIDMSGAAADVKTRKASLRKIGEDLGDQLLGPTRKGKAENIAVMDIEDPKDLNMLLRWLAPPGVWAKKYPRIHKVWRQGVKAEVDQSVYIKRLNREWDEVTRPLSKPEFEQLTGLMFLGDAEAHAFTDAELDDFKVSDKVKTAYRGARRFIDKLGRWTEQHERNMKLDLLRRRSALIRDMAGRRGMSREAFRELYRERAILKGHMRHGRGNPDQLAADIEDADRRLHGEMLEDPEYRELAGEADSLEARLENTTVRRRTGYVPHKFFGNWQIMAQKPAPDDPDQSIRGENPAGMGWDPVGGEHGFFPSRLAAIKAAREFAQANPGRKLIVQPMEFNFPDSKATVLTEDAMRTLRDRVRKLLEVEGEELDAVLEGVARPRNRRRFAGFEQFREGMPGFNKNLDRVIRAHIGETVRYTTLDRLKYDAITAMEKEGLQRARITQERPELQKAVEAFLRDVNGQKQPVEQQVDQILNRDWATPLRIGLAAGGAAFLAAGGATTSIVAGGLIGSYIGYRVTRSLARGGEFPSRAVTAGMLSDMSHLKLGMVTNIMSAVVNLTQTGLNTYPVLGFRDTSAGIKRLSAAIASNARGKPNNDWKILVKNDVNPTFGFGEGTKNQFQKEPALSKLSMLAFTSAEGFNRSVAFLGAVNRAERQGRSWGQAVQEGKRTMERTQFHYGPANKPELLRGNFLRVPLQFKNFVAQQMTFALGVRGKEIPRFLLSLFLVAGALGLPGLDALDWLLEVVTDGEFSPIAAIKEGALELAAKGEIEGGLGQLIARGVPGALGVEISGRTGMGEKFLPLQIRDFSGPWFSTVKNAARHAQERTGVIDQIRNLSPGLGNPLRAMQAAADGGQMTSPWKRGRPEMIYTPGELITKAIGGRPTREAMEQDWRDIYRRKAERSRLGSRRYIDRAVRAVQINDRPELIRIMREAAEDGVPITGSQLRSAMRGMMTQRAERTLRTLPKSLRGEARQLRRGLDRAAPR